MDNSWENKLPAPLEYFDGELLRLFHEWRIETHGSDVLSPCVNGVVLNGMIAKAKVAAYNKYPESKETIPKDMYDRLLEALEDIRNKAQNRYTQNRMSAEEKINFIQLGHIAEEAIKKFNNPV